MMASAEDDPRRAGTIWVLNLDEETPIIVPRISVEFRRINLDTELILVSAMGPSASEEIAKRFERGCRCYAAWIDDQIVSYGWVSFEEEHIGELNLRIKLLPGEAYIWDCATLPAFCRNGLYSSLLVHILAELRAEGLCRAWIGADIDNKVSQLGMSRAGFRHVADMVVERVLAQRQVWVVGLPDVPETIVDEARRVFLNDRDKVWSNGLMSTANR
jgi:ribosomal protein S18 acetylase RimI-like enzyme